MPSPLEKELVRRADNAPSWKPGRPHGWTPAGIVAIIAALGGPAVLVPLITAWTNRIEAEAQAAKALANARAEQITKLSDEVTAARVTCGKALEEAQAARSQATAARVVAEALAPKR